MQIILLMLIATISCYAAQHCCRDCTLDLRAATVKPIVACALLPSAVAATSTRECVPASNLAKSIDVLRLPAENREKRKKRGRENKREKEGEEGSARERCKKRE